MSAIRQLWQKLRRPLFNLLFLWLIFAAVLIIAINNYGYSDYRREADVIIVLGGGITREGRASPPTARRSRQGAVLYSEGYAPSIICSGGVTNRFTERAEAEGCADILRENGVPDEAIILESLSRSTEENAFYSHAIMKERGFQTALVVSDGYHLMRARWLFADEGVELYTVPTQELPAFIDHVYGMGREVGAYHWQVLKELLDLPYTSLTAI